jgi:hypothetical protein
MRNRLALSVLLFGVWIGVPSGAATAAVVVVANRSKQEVQFTVAPPQGKAQPYTLASGDLAAIPATGRIEMTFSSSKTSQRCQLAANSAYFFFDSPGGLKVEEIGLSGSPEQASSSGATNKESVPPPSPASDQPTSPKTPGTIPVKILVDQDEPYVQKVWEKRLRQRIEEASAILQQHCHMKLEVVSVGEWKSNNSLIDFSELLRDFQQKVTVHPARLAIGFTGKRVTTLGKNRLGGISMPLHTHILIREWIAPSEPERLEVLLHELGHYLGATHSPESDSVMRPRLADGKTFDSSFRIRFDPVNTLIMNLVAEELRDRDVKRLSMLGVATKGRLTQVYSTVARTLPDDPATVACLRLLGNNPAALPKLTSLEKPEESKSR